MEFIETQSQVKLLSPLSLAFVGDAAYELLVRRQLLEHGSMPVGKLHKLAVERVRAGAQALAFDRLCDMATEQELAMLKRGRNASGVRPPRHADTVAYRKATGVEALFGYLYLTGQEARMAELFEVIQQCITGREQEAEE